MSLSVVVSLSLLALSRLRLPPSSSSRISCTSSSASASRSMALAARRCVRAGDAARRAAGRDGPACACPCCASGGGSSNSSPSAAADTPRSAPTSSTSSSSKKDVLMLYQARFWVEVRRMQAICKRYHRCGGIIMYLKARPSSLQDNAKHQCSPLRCFLTS